MCSEIVILRNHFEFPKISTIFLPFRSKEKDSSAIFSLINIILLSNRWYHFKKIQRIDLSRK